MRAEAIRRPRAARPRTDIISLTLPRNAIWIGASLLAAFGGLAFSIGLWVGRGTADQPAPVSAQMTLVPPKPAAPVVEEPPLPPPQSNIEVEQAPPPAEQRKIELQLREKTPKNRYGIQLGAFPDREEATLLLLGAKPSPNGYCSEHPSLVDLENPRRSLIVRKLVAGNEVCGSPMPITSGPHSLSPDEVACFVRSVETIAMRERDRRAPKVND